MTDVLMGITVEDVEGRIAEMLERAEKEEGYSPKTDLDQLKAALHANPDIVADLADETLGDMVNAYRIIHQDYFDSVLAKKAATKKKATAKPRGKKLSASQAAEAFDDIDLDEL